MKFDIVIGNPPYNNDLYIPFVEKGHQMASECSVFITPAKQYFISGGTEQNKKYTDLFHDMLGKATNLIFYQVEGEIFDITLPSGIMIALYKNENTPDITIENSSCAFDAFKHEEKTMKLDELKSTFNLKAYSIIEKVLGNNKPMNIERYCIDSDKRYKVAGCKLLEKATGSASGDISHSTFHVHRKGKETLYRQAYVISLLHITEVIENSTFKVIASFDDKNYAESFKSYLQTKTVRYLIAMANCGYSDMYKNEIFRFVPDPGAFDHIFTDEELYKKYNLTDKEIAIIESVIKERK